MPYAFSTDMQDENIVFGGEAKLKTAIREAYELFKPHAISIFSTCPVGLICDDVHSVARDMKAELGINVFGFSCEGYRGVSQSAGHHIANNGIFVITSYSIHYTKLYENPGGKNSHSSDGGEYSRFISGSGKAMGIDFLIKYEGTQFTSWLAYSLSKSTRHFDEINEGDEIPGVITSYSIHYTKLYEASLSCWGFCVPWVTLKGLSSSDGSGL